MAMQMKEEEEDKPKNDDRERLRFVVPSDLTEDSYRVNQWLTLYVCIHSTSYQQVPPL